MSGYRREWLLSAKPCWFLVTRTDVLDANAVIQRWSMSTGIFLGYPIDLYESRLESRVSIGITSLSKLSMLLRQVFFKSGYDRLSTVSSVGEIKRCLLWQKLNFRWIKNSRYKHDGEMTEKIYTSKINKISQLFIWNYSQFRKWRFLIKVFSRKQQEMNSEILSEWLKKGYYFYRKITMTSIIAAFLCRAHWLKSFTRNLIAWSAFA